MLTPEQKREILRERARALAQKPPRADTEEDRLEVVEFAAARERYAVESACIREVCRVKEITPLPCAPAFVAGVMNVRGQIVAVLDIKRFFGLPDAAAGEAKKVLIVRSGDKETGLLADAVAGVRSVSAADVQPPPAAFAGASPDYVKGVTSQGLAILDADKILNDEAIIVDEEVTG